MFLAKRVLLGVALAVSSVVGSGPTYGVDRFVDAAATGPDHNGRSWCTAFLALQDALEPGVLLSGDQVLVAQGTYYPDTTLLLDARDATFQLVPNIRINGGYAGCAEPVPGVRDLKAYETILSGDLARDDFLPGGGMDENAYHVITGDGNVGNATLDGVTITAGNANGSSFESRGGGVFNKNGAAPIFRNCTIRGNHATSGGGMFNQFSSPTLINCVIAENVASAGAGLFDSADARLDGSTIINCLIRDNQATGGQGGGVYAFGADTEILRSTVVRNSASGGAGLFNWSSILALKDCILWGNDDNGTVDQLAQLRDFNAVSTTVNYTCMQGWDGTLGGTENFGDDPLFAVGPLGCYYLSQTLAGESADSLCVDAGSNTAASYGLAGRTTRSDAVGDSGIVDLGYHYDITADVLLLGDADRNEIVDLFDYSDWFDCITGPIDAGLTPCCRIADFDDDEDIDLFDLAEFANAQTEP